MVDSTAMRKAFTVPEIKPLDQYDFNRAKICASLGWLLAKAYGTAENVPLDLREPFYRDQYEQEHIKPPGPPETAPASCACSPRGPRPEGSGRPVTDADLRHTPIRMSAHLAVMDALMSAVAMETVSAVKMPSGVGWENVVLYWINRLNQKLKESTEGDPPQISPPSTDLQPVQPSCPTRWYWKLVPIRYRKDKLLPKQTPTFPLVTGVKDLSNGCAVAAVIHFYCPDLLRLEDVCLKDTMSVADSLYNLQLIRDFCESCLKICCPLLLEDLLYTPPGLRVNILSFMAELLEWFEVRRPEFVRPRETLDLADISVLPDCATPTSGNSNSASPAFIFKQPFLPISSPASPGGKEGVGRAWSRKQISRPLSAVSFSIPFGLDSDVDVVMGNPVGAITRSQGPEGPGPQNGPLLLRASRGAQTRGGAENGVGVAIGEGADLPTIEEALQIIHSEGKLEPRLLPEGAPDGFFLHDDPALARLSSSAPSRSGMLYRPSGAEGSADGGAEPGRSRRPRRTSSGSRDDDSVLRDGSVDSDASEEPPKVRSTRPRLPMARPAHREWRGRQRRGEDDQLRRAKEEDGSGGRGVAGDGGPQMTTWAQRSEESPSKSPALSTEMSELGARLEEKRRAIEAQKKRIEAIFAKHRQRLGKSALLQLKKEQQGEAGVEGEGDEALAGLSLEERLQRMEREAEEEAEGDPELPRWSSQGTASPRRGWTSR
ncbi:hypothetical protein ANANG_G00035360 [Anguilla anguilla]|uniref:Calponin-homology (CH) domain-containing protein n=1 Tax=Anguilla anguilla TaxID=7936 RepID=A0A9D3MUN0_ANGAN|nr:hypothetical protein ANANG_G00035360 [Anguilla anguilla]